MGAEDVCSFLGGGGGNWFGVIAGSPEFIAQATAESCQRWRKRKKERW